jgi:hypothetical protein
VLRSPTVTKVVGVFVRFSCAASLADEDLSSVRSLRFTGEMDQQLGCQCDTNVCLLCLIHAL